MVAPVAARHYSLPCYCRTWAGRLLQDTVIMSPTPGTLYEYDMILSVSQEAINNQFKLLYDTPNPKDFQKNLIPDTMNLGYFVWDEDQHKLVPSKAGISAKIECPTVDIKDIGPGGTLYRSVRLKIKVKTGSITYWKLVTEPELKKYNIDGWTVSWVAQLGRRDIQDVEEEAMHPDAKKAIKDAKAQVPSEDFLVSSLFCLFESTQVTNSFALTNEKGQDITKDSVAIAFLQQLTITYTHMDPKDNPYVLGYGVTQDIKTPKPDTPVFLPTKFFFSTTSYDPGDFSTLNFLLINVDPHNEDLINPEKNPAAGVLDKPFVDVTRAKALKSDGIFAMSTNLFWTHWVQPNIIDKVMAIDGSKDFDDITTTGPTRTGNTTKKEWESGWHRCEPSGFVCKVRKKFTGYNTVTVTFTSALQTTPGDIPADTKRSVTINVTGEIYQKIQLETTTWFVDDWDDAGSLWNTTNWDFSLEAQAAGQGTWSVTKKTWNIPGTDHPDHHLNAITAVLVYFSGSLSTIANFFKGKSQIDESTFSQLSSGLNSISNSVIMPAGDVYSFLGLDYDDGGNLYSHIKYKILS